MKIIIAGGTGQVGQILTRAFLAEDHDVVVLTRCPEKSSAARTVPWDAKNLGAWVEEVEASDVVINLAGRSVDCRYNAKNRRLIMDSRVDSTRVIGQAIANSTRPPQVWLQASTATIYSHRYDRPNDELTGIIGGDEPDAPATWRFSIDVAREWEKAANEFKLPATRIVLLRSAMTMSPDKGGIFDVLLGLVRKGLGGTCGDGRQYVSWIHEYDFVSAVKWLIENNMAGPVNLASPEPLPNSDFMRELRKAWGIRVGLPASRWMLEVSALLLRTETELILKSRRVVPTRLLNAGFQFRYPSWTEAAAELCSRWQSCQTNTKT
jgi:uncharacterized protein (TIGR01777 family)